MKMGREDGQKEKGGDKRERREHKRESGKKGEKKGRGRRGRRGKKGCKEKQLTLSGEPQTLAGVHIAPALQRKNAS